MIILSGNEASQVIKARVKTEIEQKGLVPCLSVILVGEDPASEVYVRNKLKTCKSLGIESQLTRFPANVTESELLQKIYEYNDDSQIHGILVQLPLPKHIDEFKVIEAIDPMKDVDCLGSRSMGLLLKGNQKISPCTPAGILEMLDHYKLDIEGKEVVVVGRSNIVGKPLAQLLVQRNATVSICHSKTKNLREICQRADMLFVAIGKRAFIDGSYLKPGATVIDVGIHRGEDNKLCGDLNFDSASSKAGAITPVPGGVGPMTIAMLMHNTLRLCALQSQL